MFAPLPLPDPELADDVVALRTWGSDDLVDLLTASGNELVHRYRYSLPSDIHEARAWLAAVERDRLHGERLELAVTAPGSSLAVGSVSLSGLHPRNRSAMIGYWLAPGGRGRGLATAAVRLLSRWAFDVLGQQRLALEVEVENVASQRVAQRSGFRCEGRMLSHLQRRDGTRADVLVYGLLAGEPPAARR